ncbi:MAG: hypothetical protein ACK4OM_02840 [Alphaproteobacteria bacterium]
MKEIFEKSMDNECLNNYEDHVLNLETIPVTLTMATALPSNDVIGMNYALSFLKTSFERNGFIEYIKHPQKMLQHSSNNIQDNSIYEVKKLPSFFHAVWLTNKHNPKKINVQIENFLEQAERIPDFKSIIWTNLEPAKFLEMNPELKNENISIKNIAQLNTDYKELLDIILNPSDYLPSHNAHIFNGFLIDLTKYLIMESQGGILADLNFNFGNEFNINNIEQFDFIAPNMGFTRIENGFFIAKPHHIIFKELLTIINDMLINPDYGLHELKNKLASNHTATEIFSMMPLAISYIMNNNQGSNQDVLTSTKCNNLPDTVFPLELLELIKSHEDISYKLDSKDFNDINDFTISYINLTNKLKNYDNFKCIDVDLVGADHMSVTWWNANIV